MESLEEVIAAHKVKEDYAAEDVLKLEEEWALYNETGFELKARELRRRLLFAKAVQKLSNPIIVKRPGFRAEYDYANSLPTLWLGSVSNGWYGDSICLYEVEPSVFKGDVPTVILETTLAAKTLGFKPYVWFVSRQSEVSKYLNSPQARMDPAIVAYPIVGQESGRDVVSNDFGILLGIWGKDIPEIDKALENNG